MLSADLLPFLKLGSIANSQTSNPNSERGKNWSKTMEKQKKNTPCHLSSFSSDPLMGQNFLFFWFSRGFCHLGPKMPQNPCKNQKKNVSPNVACPASPQTLSMGRNFLFFFLEVFATVSVQQYQLLMFFVFFCFPVSWAPRNFHPDKHPLAQLSPLHSLY